MPKQRRKCADAKAYRISPFKRHNKGPIHSPIFHLMYDNFLSCNEIENQNPWPTSQLEFFLSRQKSRVLAENHLFSERSSSQSKRIPGNIYSSCPPPIFLGEHISNSHHTNIAIWRTHKIRSQKNSLNQIQLLLFI